LEVLRLRTTQEVVEVAGVQSHYDRCLQSSKEDKVLCWWEVHWILLEDPKKVFQKSSRNDRDHCHRLHFLEVGGKKKRRVDLDTYCYYLLLRQGRGHQKTVC